VDQSKGCGDTLRKVRKIMPAAFRRSSQRMMIQYSQYESIVPYLSGEMRQYWLSLIERPQR
jgi:hypothetical protein